MPDVYSPALAVALGLAGLGLVAALVARFRSNDAGTGRTRRVARASALLSLAALAVAVVSHAVLGHSAGSENPLDAGGFVVLHPMVLFVAILGLAGLALSRSS